MLESRVTKLQDHLTAADDRSRARGDEAKELMAVAQLELREERKRSRAQNIELETELHESEAKAEALADEHAFCKCARG